MAAVTRSARVAVRSVRPGEGTAVAALWRELWDAHERWGGYAGSRDPRVYAHVASRLEDDARVRAGQVVLGRHAHLLAEVDGIVCGQVEGWLDHLGLASGTPLTCEVRSLIVAQRARRSGAGRALLTALADAAKGRVGGARCVLAAEVLEPNPARAFYGRVGYAPVAWSARIDALAGCASPAPGTSARLAVAYDALAVARLETSLAIRRRDVHDVRFDAPHSIDATMVQAIAAHLGSDAATPTRDAATLVALDAQGAVRASASFTVQLLEPPFLPVRRALLGRFAVDPANDTPPLLATLIGFGCRLAVSQGAQHVELVDLTPPGSPMYDAALRAGAVPWSRIVMRVV